MGDGGLCYGAALYDRTGKSRKKYEAITNVYLGPSYSDNEVRCVLETCAVKYRQCDSIEDEVAALLSKGEMVARCNGAMEFAPRALGNRSLLVPAVDASINDTVNKKLGLSEFMPFAPSTLESSARRCYKNTKGAMHTAKFMTITFNVTDSFSKSSPAVTHIDGTARPQLVAGENRKYMKIINDYRKLTGIPTIVNTSFNMHEEPIVCSPQDAIRSFLTGRLDYLAIGNFLVRNRKK